MVLASLSTRQKISIAAAALAAGAGLFAFVRWQRERDFRPLATSLAAEDAGAVVQKLKETGTPFRLADNGATVLVPSQRVAELRLAMASAGLPRSGRMGFELFDKNALGASEFAEQINYHRALEGELERSIGSLAEVEQARVHVTFAKDSVYLEARQPAKASVVVRLRAGARLAPNNILAICHLVASAVEGLAPEAVSVLDMNGNLLNRARPAAGPDGAEPPDALFDYRHRIEADLLAKINATLEPLLGPERFRAGVFVDCDFTSGEQSEEIFDPNRSVMVTSQRSEDGVSLAGSAGVPGSASNLPRPSSRPAASSSGTRRQTESITYQSSRTVKRVRIPQGNIRKVSVSVLVDQAVRWEGQGAAARRVLVPPPPEKLKTIRELVAGVTGLTTERGDQLIVETLPFDATERLEPPPAPDRTPAAPPARRLPWNPQLTIPAAIGAGVLVLLGAGAAVAWRRARRRRAIKASATTAPAIEGASEEASQDIVALDGAVTGKMDAQLNRREALKQRLDADAMERLKISSPVASKKTEVLSKHIRESLAKNNEISVHILRGWLHQEDEVK